MKSYYNIHVHIMKVKEKREMSNHVKSKVARFFNLLFLEEVMLPKF